MSIFSQSKATAVAPFENQPTLTLASEMQQSFAHRQPLSRQSAMGIIHPPPSTPVQATGMQAQAAPSQGRPTPLTRQYAIHLFAPPPPPVQLTAPPSQPASVTPQPLQRQKTLIVTHQVPRRRCRFTPRPLRREGALYGEADFRTTRPLTRTYAFYGEFPKNEHLPLLSARPSSGRTQKKGVKFLRRPAGPSAKAAVLGQPKSILKYVVHNNGGRSLPVTDA
ncbi:hypothetical protein BDZ89DRAFT_1063283 [Hymenopellis radicata]|nr:hypothetical protein BDZ89DRAFT_1063283 [Hymenopellis radicata]